MKLTSETKIFLGIILFTIAVIIGATVIFSKPAPTIAKEKLIPAGSHSMGNPNAKVNLVEFSDYECPACKAIQPVIDEIVQKNKDKLLFVYRNFPLDQHPFAMPAAQAAEAAGLQGKYWEMHNLLFQNQDKLSNEIFPQLARDLQLDETKFSQDFTSQSIKDKILFDRADGIRFDVQATPTFYLNGQKMELVNFTEFRKAIEEAINSK